MGGAVCLALSLGTYQAYLPFAALLCLYGIVMLAVSEKDLKEKIRRSLRYLYMGVLGLALYYVILRILLAVQGKTLDTYQGISGMTAMPGDGFLSGIKQIYIDFFAFTIKGNILWNNIFSAAALIILTGLALFTALHLVCEKKWWKNPWFYFIIILLAAGCPAATNLIPLVSPQLTYHLLMRYQWVLYPILMIAFVSRYGGKAYGGHGCCFWQQPY